MYDLLLKPLSKSLSYEERGFDSYSPSLAGKGLGVRFSLCLGMLLSLAVMGCTPNSQPQGNTTPQVVATSTIIADLAEEIGGEEVQITGILKPGADPHVYEPVPADSRVLEKANLILYNGYNLEPGIIKLMNATGGKTKKIAVGEVVKSLKLDKGKGQIVPDPHVWGSAENVIAMVKAIRDSLIELSPEDKNKFTQNAEKLTDELQQLHLWIVQQIQTIPADKRKLITTHDAFQYYGNAYKIAIAGTLIGISTEEQPSAQTVKKLVESVKKIGVPAIFAETTINPALIKTVAEEAGVKLAPTPLYSDSIGAKGSSGDTYIKMMAANTRAIVEALGGKYTPFQLKSEK
ncbi:periplasmic solute binding protein [Dolichospermum compactum NIES-806]|uniref:Periplasmic solute binding protein n=2 Tax=Dolichospermum compactum TaxID=136073 RepID=A0A1Z4V8B3_9CYAN|nr:periplasmic solute binding protein [Dolichospermum compactum NIES-806]